MAQNYSCKKNKKNRKLDMKQNKNINSLNTIDKQSKANINIESCLQKHYMLEQQIIRLNSIGWNSL